MDNRFQTQNNTIAMERFQQIVGDLYLQNRLQAELIAKLQETVARLQAELKPSDSETELDNRLNSQIAEPSEQKTHPLL